MNTTKEISPELAENTEKGFYVPTIADCEEAGMDVGLNGMDRPIAVWEEGKMIDEERWEIKGDYIVFDDEDAPEFVSSTDSSQDRPLVFGDRDKCMAFLQNHMVTAAEQGGLN